MNTRIWLCALCAVVTLASTAQAQDCDEDGFPDEWQVVPAIPNRYALRFGNPNVHFLAMTEGQYVLIGDDPELDLRNQFTLEAWVMPEDLSGIRKRVISKGRPAVDGYGFGSGDFIVGDLSNLRFTTFGVKDYETAGLYLQEGIWTHIAVVMTAANNARFFVDGKFVEQVNGPQPAKVNNRDLLFARNPFESGAEPWIGLIDEVRIWNVARTEVQIAEDYDMPFRAEDVDPEGLLGYWHMNEGKGELAADNAGVFDGLLVGFPLWVHTRRDLNGNRIPDVCECWADLNDDGVVDDIDLELFQQALAEGDQLADLNNDGVIDELDIQIFRNEYLDECRVS